MSEPYVSDVSAEELVDNFDFLEDWDDRFRYIIDLGRKLPPLDESDKTPETKVEGCTSQVWIVSHCEPGNPPRMLFCAESDAHIVKGLIAILLTIYSGKSPREILQVDYKDIIGRIGFEQHLSPNRANGLYAMIERIRQMAAEQAALVG